MTSVDIVIAVILISLASARISRLIVSDTIMQPIRDRFLIEGEDETYLVKDTFLAKLIHCTWCTGVWITAGIGILYFTVDWFVYPCILIAASYIQGFLNSLEG